MGTEAQTLKDCPSCGSRIAEAAVKCSFCKSGLGHCEGCNAWIVVGTECLDCGKSTAVRARQAVAAVKEPPRIGFEAPAAALIPVLLIRLVLAAACLGAVAMGVAAAPLGRASQFVREHGFDPKAGWPTFAAVAGGLLILVGFCGLFVRRFRMSHTILYGKPVEVTTTLGSILLNLFITAIVLAATAGLGLPWLYARYRRSFYRGCSLPGRGNRPLGFDGTGDEVLGRFFLALLLLPLGIATGGLLFGLISWIWVKWETSNVILPDRNGQYRHAQFNGSFAGYQVRWMGGWLVSLATAGLFRPWVKCAEWRWIAANTEVP